jgi:nucleotide-binding universal stress UspA family protein
MIPEYRTILYATDLTANAANAFRHALAIARRHEARVHIAHVLPEVDAAVINYVATVMGEDQLADLEIGRKEEVARQIRERLAAFARAELADFPDDLRRVAGVEVLHGHPAAELLKAADRLQADLIILGSHGKGRLRYSFLGSVAEKILRKSRRPVLVVPIDE